MSDPANMNAMENNLPRPDVMEKVSGAAKFGSDVYPEKMVYARYLRFPFGHGKVANVDEEAARKVPGVVQVWIEKGKECRYPGDSFGNIVAESVRALEDGIAALRLKFERTEPRTNPQKLYEGVPAVDSSDETRLEKVFQNAVHTVEATYSTQVQTHSSLETHGALVDIGKGKATAWASTQSLMSWKDDLVGTSGLGASDVTVNSVYVGGGFGSKFGMGAEGGLAAGISKQLGRPVRVFATREEEHLATGNRPGSIQYMKIGIASDGKILGGRIHLANVVGPERGGGGITNPKYYDFGDFVRTETDITLNGGWPAAFRAPGYPQGCFAIESMMDELAAAANMDPIEFRVLNETSERRKRQYPIGAKLIGWSERKADGAGTGIIKTGYGVGSATWGNSPGRAEADIDVFRTGEVEVRMGVQDIGTGTSAVVADAVAEQLGLERKWVRAKYGVSDYPPAPASGGSVVTRTIVPALRDAADKASTKLKETVAGEWGAKVEEVSYKDATFFGPAGQKLKWEEACKLIHGDRLTAHGAFNKDFFGEGTSDCVQFAKVEVDTETGIVTVKKIVAVHAMGKPVNRLTAENQICGGVIQGLSYALLEDRILDRNTGAMVNANFIDYKIAGPKDIPEIVPVIDADEKDTGARSLGEPATIPTSGAIANAVANAIGVRVRSLPITPDKVLEALEKKGKSA